MPKSNRLCHKIYGATLVGEPKQRPRVHSELVTGASLPEIWQLGNPNDVLETRLNKLIPKIESNEVNDCSLLLITVKYDAYIKGI